MSEQPGNRIPTSAPRNFQSSDPSDVTKTESGNRPWESHPATEEAHTIAAQEHFKQQGSLPARKKLSSEDGSLEVVKGQDQ